MEVKISLSNSKLGMIPSVNLPPIVTCRENCPCAGECYARKGHFLFENVKESMRSNLVLYKRDSEKYFNEIRRFVNNGLFSYSYFRWHAAGDIVDKDYLTGMVRVAKELPSTKFLAFTKKFEMVNDYLTEKGSFPRNLNLVLSAWGDSFPLKNLHCLPIAYVRFKDGAQNKMIPSTAAECSGDCSTCLQCWNIKCGQSVVFNKH